MDRPKEHARHCLEANGFRVQDIDECSEERADLLASDGVDEYVVEVKSKEVSAECENLIAEAANSGLATLDRDITTRNRIDAVVKKADAQLAATPAAAGAFRILWVSCLSGDACFIHRQFERTLYGDRDVMLHDGHGKALLRSVPCYYYDFSSFYACPGIDAAILSGPDTGYLCVNDCSPRYEAFRRSRLYAFLPDRAVLDPVRQEQVGEALRILGKIDRRDSTAKWKYLRDTYGYMTAPMRAVQFTGLLSLHKQ